MTVALGKPSNLDLITLVAANAFTLVAFIFFGGSIMQVLWIYWLQSVLIGGVNVLRILRSSSAIVLGAPPAINKLSRWFLAWFFVFHYGGFHFVYFVFLAVFSMGSFPLTINGQAAGDVDLTAGGVNVLILLLNGLLFGLHHYFSYKHEERESKNIMMSFFKPYGRIMPMHLIIITGPVIVALTNSTTYVFALFILLKTIADVILFEKRTSHPIATSTR